MIKGNNFSSCQWSRYRVQHHGQLHRLASSSSVCAERVCAIIIIALLSIFPTLEPLTHLCVCGIDLHCALDGNAGDFSDRIKAGRGGWKEPQLCPGSRCGAAASPSAPGQMQQPDAARLAVHLRLRCFPTRPKRSEHWRVRLEFPSRCNLAGV